jgi:hypothetical protein
MSAGLTITGAVFELFGLMLVFIELAILQGNELGIPPWWTSIVGRIRRLLGHEVVFSIPAGGARAGGNAVYGRARPDELSGEASQQNRIERLEEYVRRIDADLNSMWTSISRAKQDAIIEARRLVGTLRDELRQDKADERAKLKPSIRRQQVGALLVVIGLALGTVGNVI